MALALHLTHAVGTYRLGAERSRVQAEVAQSRWAAFGKLEEAVRLVSGATVIALEADKESSERFVDHLENACRELSQLMQTLTGTPCRVSIQGTYEHDNGLVAVQRVASSSYGRSEVDSGAGDFVEHNTDFASIVKKKQPHYICNDLPAELSVGYKNSHWTEELLALWKATGEYPYRSTAVYPVGGPSFSETSGHELAGFVSIDSKETGVFQDDIVGVAARTLATATYASLVQIRAQRMPA